MRLYILIAFRNLVKARRRTLLLGAAIAIVTMLMVMLMSLSQGLTDTMIKNVTLQLAGHVNVAGFFKAKSSDAIPMVTRVKELRKIVEENTPDLDYVIDRGRGWGKMISNVTSIQVIISSVDIDEEKNFVKTIQLAKENEYRKDGKPVALGDPMKLREPKQIMISETQAKRMQLTVGDPVSLTVESAGGMANLTEATVCAVTKANGFMSNWNVFVSKKTLSDLYDMDEDASGAIMVYLKDIKNSETAMKKLRIALTEKGFDLREYQPDPYWMKFEDVKEEDFRGQKLDLTTWSDEAKFAQWILTAFSTISFVLITILTAIIVIGIMNAMWIAVRERTREIGTARAIGLSKRGVLSLFMLESFMLGLFSTIIGSSVGALIGYSINRAQIPVGSDAVKMLLMSDTINLSVNAGQVVFSVVIFTVITCLASAWPAFKASRMQPVKAIGHIG